MFIFGGRLPAVEGNINSMRRYKLTYADYEALKNEATLLKRISPVLNREDIRAVSEYNQTNGQVFGVAAPYNQIRTIPMMTGRWLSDKDEADTRRVAVLGFGGRKKKKYGGAGGGGPILLKGKTVLGGGGVGERGEERGKKNKNKIFFSVITTRQR